MVSWIKGSLCFKLNTEPWLSLEKRKNLALMLRKIENGKYEAYFVPGPAFLLEPFQVINMHYSYVIFPLTVGV